MRIYSIIVCAFLFFSSCKSEDKNAEKEKSQVKDQKAMVVDGIIAKEEMTTGFISSTGSIMANESVELKSEISGKVTGIFFKEGTYISKGQLLVKLDDEDLTAQMNKIKIEIKLAAEIENRQKQLLAASAISREEYDVAQGNVSILKANESILKTNINKTKITAPFSGLIGLKNISPGAIITPASVIANIQNIQPLKIEFSIPEKYNNLVPVGKQVSFKVSGLTTDLKATVYAKEPKIDEATRTSRVRATFSNINNKILPGSFAELYIPIGEKTKVKMIPTMAYIPDINGAKVFIKKNGMAVTVPVTAGIRTEKDIQILDGIQDGDTIITSGILLLKRNTPVEVNIINQTQ